MYRTKTGRIYRSKPGHGGGKSLRYIQAFMLNREQVYEIHRLFWNSRMTMENIAQRFGVTKMTISQIVKGQRWRDVAEEMIPPEFRPRARTSSSPSARRS